MIWQKHSHTPTFQVDYFVVLPTKKTIQIKIHSNSERKKNIIENTIED
jgi:hypothetical protein